MPDPAPKPDALDEADALFRSPSPTLDELLAGVEPISAENDLVIPGLTDEEWEAFVTALNDSE